MPTDRFAGRVAIVTGASIGIGRAAALDLAALGACVALAARREEMLNEVAAEIRSRGGEALVIKTDVSHREEVDRMVAQVLEKWGRVDILVSNAGQYIRRPIVDVDPSELQRSLDVNYFGGVYCILAVLPHMLKQRSGSIVAVTSMDGKIGLPPDAPYVSAKFALTGFLEVLRQELRGTGVSVTNIMPGRVDTPMVEHLRFHWLSPKLPAEQISRAIVSAIKRPRAYMILPPTAYLLYWIYVFIPPLGDRLARWFRLEGWEP